MPSSLPPSSSLSSVGPTPLSPADLPPSTVSPPPPPPRPNALNLQFLKAAIPLSISKTNAHIAHLNRLTTSTPRLDTLLSTLTYTLTLLQHSSLPLSSPSLHSLTTLISQTRTTLRLLGLFPIYIWATTFLSAPPTADPILSAITAAQIVACAVYQALENAAFLADQGVLRGVGAPRVKGWWRWSSRAWMVYVGLEGGRLGWEAWNGGGRGEEGKRGGEERELVEREKWWREVLLNAAYAPMTVHWSYDGGVLSEAWIGALGLVAGVVGFRQAWKETT